MTKTYVVCNENHQRLTRDFATREQAEEMLKKMKHTKMDDGGMHVVEKQTPGIVGEKA